jgi:hypothetical protein
MFDVSGKDKSTKGWWPATRVTSDGRYQITNAFVILKYGDVFTIVTVNDEGPYDIRVPSFEDNGTMRYPTPKTYFVALHNGVLIWMEHNWLEQCTLIEDAE